MQKPVSILVSGMIAKVPGQGGAAWAVLQYVVGLARLGHEVYFIEPIEPADIRPAGAPLAASINAEFFMSVVREFELEGHAALVVAGTDASVGLSHAEVRRAAEDADILINVSGTWRDRDITDRIGVRLYLDLDPVFNQLWHTGNVDVHLDGHTHYATVGQAIGDNDSPVPTCGVTWIPTLQPVVLDMWPVAGAVTYDGLTTIANWRGYGSIEYGGVFYGQKAHTLRELIDLPKRTSERLILALAIHPDEVKDLQALRQNGWELIDPASVADTPSKYRTFVQGSKAELGVAKSGYVKARSGWFSDRSACYLASGRPVLAQDTGFSRYLPTGRGLLRFESSSEAADGIEATTPATAPPPGRWPRSISIPARC
jgi:hypothetical protein